jgi:hypothetical protein
LLNQRNSVLQQLDQLRAETNKQRDILLKVEGAIEYLQKIGVELPSQDEQEEFNEVEETEEENT